MLNNTMIYKLVKLHTVLFSLFCYTIILLVFLNYEYGTAPTERKYYFAVFAAVTAAITNVKITTFIFTQFLSCGIAVKKYSF